MRSRRRSIRRDADEDAGAFMRFPLADGCAGRTGLLYNTPENRNSGGGDEDAVGAATRTKGDAEAARGTRQAAGSRAIPVRRAAAEALEDGGIDRERGCMEAGGAAARDKSQRAHPD